MYNAHDSIGINFTSLVPVRAKAMQQVAFMHPVHATALRHPVSILFLIRIQDLARAKVIIMQVQPDNETNCSIPGIVQTKSQGAELDD